MVEKFPGLRVRDYIEKHRQIAKGYSKSEIVLGSGTAITGVESFVEYILELHKTIFEEAFPTIAGRFRLPTDPGVTVGHGAHRYEGALLQDIEPRLRSLALSQPIYNAPETVEAFAHWAARFCQAYFAIHPFNDGNGRTGRFLVEVAARRTGTLRVKSLNYATRGEHTKDRSSYLYALQYAHKYCGLTPASRYIHRGSLDPFMWFAQWWRLRIEPVSEELIEEPPDPSETSDRKATSVRPPESSEGVVSEAILDLVFPPVHQESKRRQRHRRP